MLIVLCVLIYLGSIPAGWTLAHLVWNRFIEEEQ
jgi:hypothetical protein